MTAMSASADPNSSTGPARPELLTVDFYDEPDGIAIHKRRGGGPGVFLLLWLIAWTVGCVALIAKFIDEPSLWMLAFAVPFWASWLAVAGFLVWILFGQETLLLRRDSALFLRKAVVTISSRIVPIEEIQSFRECRSRHTENDEHLWGIEMVTLGKPLQFAFRLPDLERAWLIDQLNRFLRKLGRERNVEQEVLQQAAAGCEALEYESTLADPPTDCGWRFVDGLHAFEFWQAGRLSIGALAGLLFFNLFWNGIVSVFVMALIGLDPNNQAPQGWEWWGLFVFLIPFEAIGLGVFAALVITLLEPFRHTVWRFEEDRIVRQTRWPVYRKTRMWNMLDLDRLELRRQSIAGSGKPNDLATTNITERTSHDLAFVSGTNVDVCSIQSLTEGEARWLARFVLDRRRKWFGRRLSA